MLELLGLNKAFGSLRAVSDITLAIREGEVFSLLGPSGCGKTTLLRLLAGFETLDSGEIRQDGIPIDHLPPNERNFNMVFQRYALFPHLNVWENVAFGLKMKKVSAPEIKSRVEEILALVQMESFGGRSISTLSGGQQQRIALVRALVNRPKVLLLDEPLSALDLKLRQQMQIELLALQRKLKLTFIFVTHDQEEALTLSSRIAVMNAGLIEQVGTGREIYDSPKTQFVARFIGTMNSIDGVVSELSSEKASISSSMSASPLRVKSMSGREFRSEFSVSSSVQILVRPEKVKISKSKFETDRNLVEGRLKEVLYQGPVTYFFVQVSDVLPPLVALIPSSAFSSSGSGDFLVGARVFLSWSPEDSLLMGRN